MLVDFNPHTSYEVWHDRYTWEDQWIEFQSTHLIRGVTLSMIATALYPQRFQSTHLIRGVTTDVRISQRADADFNPHTSYEVWQPRRWNCSKCCHISIHTPHTRCDLQAMGVNTVEHISIHTPHTRCDSYRERYNAYVYDFNPHTSYEVWQGWSSGRNAS